MLHDSQACAPSQFLTWGVSMWTITFEAEGAASVAHRCLRAADVESERTGRSVTIASDRPNWTEVRLACVGASVPHVRASALVGPAGMVNEYVARLEAAVAIEWEDQCSGRLCASNHSATIRWTPPHTLGAYIPIPVRPRPALTEEPTDPL